MPAAVPMRKAGSVKASSLKGKNGPSVLEMEDRLETLKQQMAVERAKREQLLQRNGTGSFWLNGREGALRGPGVKEFVRNGVKEAKVKKAVAKKPVEDEQDRESPASGASTERSSSNEDSPTASGGSTPKEVASQDSRPRSTKPTTSHAANEMYKASRPSTPMARPECGVAPRSAGTPTRPMSASAVDDGGCQTERPARKEWVIKSMPRPQSARPQTYFDKIMAARRQQQQQQHD